MLSEQRKGVLITGVTGGLGGAVIRAFAEAGCPVATTYTNPEKWESLGDLREEILGLEVDLLDARAAEEAARRAAEELGGPPHRGGELPFGEGVVAGHEPIVEVHRQRVEAQALGGGEKLARRHLSPPGTSAFP